MQTNTHKNNMSLKKYIKTFCLKYALSVFLKIFLLNHQVDGLTLKKSN